MVSLRGGSRWPIYPIRGLAVLLLVQVLGQAVLAGGFVSGNVELLSFHSAIGIFTALTAMALVPATVLLLRPGRGPWWPIPVAVGVLLLIIVQVGVGFARELGVHIPLGVAIFGLVTVLTAWSFAYRPTWAGQ